MTVLLDANVLIAASWAPHAQHAATQRWFEGLVGAYATCPTTQGALARFLVRSGVPGAQLRLALETLMAEKRHVFLSEGLPYAEVELSRLTGHRQVTDAYLAALARRNEMRLATFDRGLAALHPDVADLLEP